jgi:hypothetical protein
MGEDEVLFGHEPPSLEQDEVLFSTPVQKCCLPAIDGFSATIHLTVTEVLCLLPT